MSAAGGRAAQEACLWTSATYSSITPVLDELRRGFEAGLWEYQTSVLPENER